MRTYFAVTLVAATLLATGCSSSNKCEKACKKIARCYGDAGGAPACNYSATCDAREQCQASCVTAASCADIMSNAQSLQSCIASCASVSTGDQGIVIPEGGGTPDLGPLPEGGFSDIYVLPDFSWPADTVPAGPARGKFCNNLLLSGNNFTATLKLGTAPNQWVISAYSGECQPVAGLSCPVIPTPMTNPAVELTDGTQTLISGTLNTTIQGGEWLFIATVDSNQQATVQGGQFRAGIPCTSDPTQQP
jgi:hypothetical protein